MNTIEEKLNHEDETAPPPVGEAIVPADAVPAPPVQESPPATPRKSRKPLLVVVSGAALIIFAGIGYWKRASLQQVNPYIPVVIPSLIAASQIRFKDWNSYNPKSIRYLLLLAVFIACGWGILYQDQQMRDKATASARADTARTAQQDNTAAFTKSFSALSTELGDLKTKLTTEDLQKKIVTFQAKLDKALNPLQAKLAFSFAPFKTVKVDDSHNSGEPVTEKTLSLSPDGNLHVDFTVLNLTDVDAIDGEMTLQICDVCKFAKEPAEFSKLAGQDERQRHKTFDRIHSKVAFYTLSADITVPAGSKDVALGMYFRCNTCVRDPDPVRIMAHLVPSNK
jgi:hypothetical protein